VCVSPPVNPARRVLVAHLLARHLRRHSRT
jgi:hypothetical protein